MAISKNPCGPVQTCLAIGAEPRISRRVDWQAGYHIQFAAQVKFGTPEMGTIGSRKFMTNLVQQLVIHGLTIDGQRFRPSDWAERLAGVMSQFRPAGSSGGHLTYSPYVVPVVLDGVRCVVVNKRLRELEPLAWKFVCDFAVDNNLKTTDQETVVTRRRP